MDASFSSVTPWNDFNEYTLTLMSNRSQYGKYMKSNGGTDADNSHHYNATFRKERRYYKKRIIALTKDLFSKKCEDKDVVEPFNEYLRCCIKYLKFKDMAEIVQEEHTADITAEEVLQKRIDDKNEDDAAYAGNEDDVATITQIPIADLSKINKLCMNPRELFKPSLDTFITVIEQPPPKFPQIREFNLDMKNNAEKKQKKIIKH
jgi:hypothetical protein